MDFIKLAHNLGEALEKKGLMLATAESCTGGQIAEVVTSVSGSASWFERGFVTYSNEAKVEMLGVNAETIRKNGAVSEQTAREMAEGALANSHAKISLAVTGVAGPTGGTNEKPVGTVCFAWSKNGLTTVSTIKHYKGDRASIRSQATAFALTRLLEIIKNEK